MEKGLKIGFKNFKKFQDFPMIELAPITFLVGPNNSGKSSFIKAFTFLFANLDSQKRSAEIRPSFMTHVSFYHNGVANFEWGDFSTTLNRSQESHEISFSWELRDTLFSFSFGASKEDISDDPSLLTTLPIKTFVIKNNKLGITIENSLNDEKWLTVTKIDPKVLQEWLKNSTLWLKNSTLRLKSIIQRKSFLSSLSAISGSWSMPRNVSFNNKIEDQLNEFEDQLNEYKQAEKSLKEKGNNDYIIFEENPKTTLFSPVIKEKVLRDYCDYCINYIAGKRFGKSLISPNFAYIETHNAPHSLTINREDKNSFLAQTIADFYSKVPQVKDSSAHSFIVKWMKEDEGFGFGNDFEISTHFGGEIFAVNIVKKDEIIPLGTLGTGAIQVFVLLLKLATILKTIGEDTNIVVLIEEPEQNLHPALQSKLAELFLDVYRLSGGRVSFIIETHSEYLIRRTQVMVAEEHYADDAELEEKNPFKVYYFPEKGLPYDMKYRRSGKFFNSFGSGFFNVSDDAALELFDINNI